MTPPPVDPPAAVDPPAPVDPLAPRLALPPVRLAAPTGPPPEPRSLAGRALVSIALLAGVFVLSAVVVAALVGINVAVFAAGRIVPYLVIITLGVVVALVRGLVSAVRRPPDPTDEVEVPVDDEPELHAEVRRLAEASGTRPPDRIVVVREVNAYVSEFGPLLGLVSGRRTLGIGTPLLDGLDVTQLRSVLAHELGHLAGGDTRMGPLTYRTDQVLSRIITTLRNGIVARVFAWYWHLQRRVSSRVRRSQEVVADRAAVRVAGRQATADALRAVEVLAHVDGYVTSAYLAPLVESGHRPDDLTGGLRGVLADPPTVASIITTIDAARPAVDPLASHPPTPERIARIAELADEQPVAHDHRAARCLLRDPERWVVAAGEAWFASVTDSRPLRPVPWVAHAELVARVQQEARATEADAALARIGLAPGLPGVHAALTSGRDRELAASLVSGGWRTGADSERSVLLAAATIAVAARHAVAAGGHRWALSWASPVALQDASGRVVALGPLVDEAVAGRWDGLLAEVVPPAPGPSTPATGGSAEPVDPAGRSGANPGAAYPGAAYPGAPYPGAAYPGTANLGAAVGPPPPPVAPPMAAAPSLASPTPPVPPQPPFVATPEGGFVAELSGRVGRSTTIGVDLAGISLDGVAVAYDRIAHVRLALKAEQAAIGPSRQVNVRVELDTVEGARVAASARAAMSPGKADANLATFGFLWDLFSATCGVAHRVEIGERLARGEPVELAGLTVSSAGLTIGRRERQYPWSDVGDPVLQPPSILVPCGARVEQVGLDERDAYLLTALLPALRARFA
ncbi:M48 family metallopeptidase [Iamia sp.]|uniref:M48 family metallopeptidase n=1 Tax=Iamia sp. TaxID=2722710 RepID=UPI002CF58DCC|nr:M48 family metallopeptidase [Iamia sp.]HXH58769.1 M48 family metallopeptidase [Iamia sp.]